MEAAAVLEVALKVYSKCRTYSDTGEVKMVPPIGHSDIRFRTQFVRPGKFRFQWSRWHPYFGPEGSEYEHSIWTDGEQTKSKIQGKVEARDSLAIALATAAGASSGAALRISSILMPDLMPLTRSWHTLNDLILLPDEPVNEAMCFHIRGSAVSEGDTDIWISKEGMILRRIREHKLSNEAFVEGRYIYECTYSEVMMNEDLPAEIFHRARRKRDYQ
jgi:hypothetical protein